MIKMQNNFPRININRSRMEVLQATLPSSIELNKLDNIQDVDVKLNILMHLLDDVNLALQIIEQNEMEVA